MFNLGSRRAALTIGLVAGAFFMEYLDGTVIAAALPAMAKSFGVPAVDLNIGMSSYIMTLAAFIPACGWMADRFGARNVFASAIVVFTLSSILCGMSQGIWSFTAARILQGLGGAMMVPVGRLVIMRSIDQGDVAKAISYIVWPGLVAPVLGPPIGGFITTFFDWRYIFWLNVPLGIVAFLMAVALIVNEKSETRYPFDTRGCVLVLLSIVPLMYGLELLGRQPTPWVEALPILVLGAAAAALTIRHMRRAPHPLLDFFVLGVPAFRTSVFAGSLFRIGFSAVPFLAPLMLQLGLGMSAFVSGLLVLCLFAGNVLIKPATTPMMRRFGLKNMFMVNGSLGVLSLVSFAFVGPATPLPVIGLLLLFNGVVRSVQFTVITMMNYADVPKAKMGAANTFSSMVQQAMMALGVTGGAIAIHVASVARGEASIEQPSMTTFHIAFLLIVLAMVFGLVRAMKLPANAGQQVTGHKQPAK